MSGLGLALGARLLPVRAFFGSVPRWVWIGLAIALAALLSVLWHGHVAGKALKAADKAGYDRRSKEVEQRALKLKAKVDALTAKITTEERNRNAEAHRGNDAAANALLVRGPGKAVCSVRPIASSPALRDPGRPSGALDGKVAGLPEPGGQSLIALPFDDTVGFSREADSCQIDRKSWEQWYGRLVKAWPTPPTATSPIDHELP